MTRVFVTVGTTVFEPLISLIYSLEFQQHLCQKWNISELIIQHGRCSLPSDAHVPTCSYEYKPSLLEDMNHADIIISHAGTGSILEALELKKLLFVVVNEQLMDNHQLEFAKELSDSGYLHMSTLDNFIHEFDLFMQHPPTKPWPKVNTKPIENLLHNEILL